MKQILYGLLLTLLLGVFAPIYSASNTKPNIVVLATGGAISARSSASTDTRLKVGEVGVDSIVAQSIESLKLANISGEQIAQVASQAMTDDIWFKIAIRVQELVDDPKIDGVIVTHGTDTL